MVLTENQIETTITSFLRDRQLRREENSAWDTNLLQLADFAHMLLYKQHALYPHLRPMYRTVHRQVPRRLVFRAIRWVNPARMFKSAMLTRQQIADMSPEERAKAIAEIADYRREAHLIRNRYNEMISLIHEGKLPYYIRHAGVKIQTMEQYLERAERLKLGTSDWEFELDKKAVEFREEMGKHGEKFDDVRDLWKDGLPPFFDPKRGREKKAPMRLIDKEGNRLKIEIFARDFIDVHPDEIREGEDLWIPKKIEIAAEADGDPDGAVPIRVPTHFVDNHFSNARNFLENEGQFQTELGDGRKVVIRHNKLDDPHARREFRATQKDPLWGDRRKAHDPRAEERRVRGEERTAERVKGRWGQDPHAGGVPGEHGSEQEAAGLGGDVEPHPSVGFPAQAPVPPGAGKQGKFKLPSALAATQAGIQAKQPASPWPSDKGVPNDERMNFGIGGRANPVQMNTDMQKNVDDLGLENQFLYDEFDLSNIDPTKDVKFINFFSGGINANKGEVMVVEIKGKKFVYKISAGEQWAEMATYAMDRTMGFGVQPHIKIVNLGMTWLQGHTNSTQERAIRRNGEKGGGFLMELHPDFTELKKDVSKFNDALKDLDNRQRFFGILALDVMLGNPDRHYGNLGVNALLEIVAVDTGFGARFADVEQNNMRTKGLLKWEMHRDKDHTADDGYDDHFNHPQKFTHGQLTTPSNIDLENEFDDWFDEHFDMNKALEVAEAANLQAVGKFMDGGEVTTEAFKERLKGYVIWQCGQGSAPSWMNYGSNAKVNLTAEPPAVSGVAGPAPAGAPSPPRLPGLTQGRPFTPGQSSGAGAGGAGVAQPILSSKDSRPEFQLIKQKYE